LIIKQNVSNTVTLSIHVLTTSYMLLKPSRGKSLVRRSLSNQAEA